MLKHQDIDSNIKKNIPETIYFVSCNAVQHLSNYHFISVQHWDLRKYLMSLYIVTVFIQHIISHVNVFILRIPYLQNFLLERITSLLYELPLMLNAIYLPDCTFVVSYFERRSFGCRLVPSFGFFFSVLFFISSFSYL